MQDRKIKFCFINHSISRKTSRSFIFNTVHHKIKTNLIIRAHVQKFSRTKSHSQIFAKNLSAKKIRENETTLRLKLTTSYQENSLSRGRGEAIDIL